MKTKVFYFLLLSCFLLSCTKEDEFTMTLNETNQISNILILKSGTFSPTSGITVSGKVSLRKRSNEHFVSLENFNISTGPDLKVYFSKSDTPNEFVNLGALGINKSEYKIPENIILDEYAYVLIHCQQYNHLFAIAKLN